MPQKIPHAGQMPLKSEKNQLMITTVAEGFRHGGFSLLDMP